MINKNYSKLIVGLGNPGPKYENTRHNIGFIVLDQLCKKLHTSSLNKNKNSYLARKNDWLFLYPLMYMNRSGVILEQILQEYKISLKDILVVVDDVNLKIGKIRIRPKGSSGGHNGLKSIIRELGSNRFKRLRIGIRKPEKSDESPIQRDLSEFVLEKFSAEENEILENSIEQAVELINHFLFKNYQKMVDSFSKLYTLSS